MWVRIRTTDKDSIETESLSAHVALQKIREATIDRELTEIKQRQKEMEEKEQERRTFVFRTLIGAIITTITSLAFVFIDYLKK